MKRHSSSAFSAGILAMAVAVAGLFSAQQAQAQTYKYGPSGINPSHHVWLQITGTQVEIRGDFRGWGVDSGGAYSGTINTSIPTVAGVTNNVNFGVYNPELNDSQPIVGWVSSTHFYIDHGAGKWTLNLESGPTFPTVSITEPSDGATYTSPATVNITASASDTDGTIAKVEFYQGATKLGEDTDSSGGWTYSWTGVAEGSYSLTAKAFDNDGLSKISAGVGITVNQRTTPMIDNAAASGLTAGSATLNGNLTSAGTAATTVYVYWGTVDRGQTTSGWDGSQNLGVRSPGAVSHSISGLSGGTPYFYRFFAQNSNGSDWGDPAASFETLSAPVVDNDVGAANITAVGARLRGALAAGGSAAVTIYWGTVDGGTSPSAWEHANSLGTASEGEFFSDVSGLNKNSTYHYRCYAENVVGTDWADATATFQTPDWSPVEATGGTITSAGDYKIHTFTAGGTFTVSAGGEVEVLLVAGGGGGGANRGGGGGGGGVIHTSSLAVAVGTYTVVVGAGGAGAVNGAGGPAAQQGGFSAFSNAVVNVTAQGGGGGGGYFFAASSGGSGGGGDNNPAHTNGASGTTGQGYAGGNGKDGVGGGGGGGAGCTGFDASATAGNGGTGLYVVAFSSWGDPNHPGYFGGGGGGGAGSGTTAGTGGWGGGANGTTGDGSATPAAAAANTGGGGGGETGGGGGSGGAGGSGIVIIRYLTVGGGIADADGDGMSDDWEDTYLGGTNASSGTAGEDYDGDGFCDLHEYIAGTNPTNAASVLKVVQVSSPGTASDFVLDWASVAGKVYSVKRIGDLMTPPWQTVASSIAATPPMNVYTVSVTGVGSGFYCVDVQH